MVCAVKNLMNRREAQASVEAIRARLDDARALLLDLYEREGWKALGYPSWRDCVTAEFEQSQAHLYRLLTAAQVERDISHLGDFELSERQARELAPLDADGRREVFEAAQANGDVTARGLAEQRAVYLTEKGEGGLATLPADEQCERIEESEDGYITAAGRRDDEAQRGEKLHSLRRCLDRAARDAEWLEESRVLGLVNRARKAAADVA